MSPPAPNLPQFLDEQQSLACIHCGLCLGSCPTYLETGNENDSPRGRIYLMRAIQEGRLPLGDTAVRHIDLCLGCRACEAACPSGVHYGELLEATREHIESHHRRSPFQSFLRRVLIERVFPHPLRMKLALAPARLLKRAGVGHLFPQFIQDSLALLPDEMSEGNLPEVSRAFGTQPPDSSAKNFHLGQGLTAVSPLPAGEGKGEGEQPGSLSGSGTAPTPLPVSLTPALSRWEREQGRPSSVGAAAVGKEAQAGHNATARGRVGFIRGCVMNVMFGHTNENSIRLLNRAGYDVVTPRDQGCCGALHAHGGNLAAARDAARANLAAFGHEPLDAIVINAAGCGSTLKEYDYLLPGDAQAAEFSAKVKDLSEFLVAAGLHTSAFAAPQSATRNPQSAVKVTFHDACHLAHAQRITHAPRLLVKAVVGANYVEMPESDVCCGSAGSYNLTEPDMAARLQRRKVENILRTGATCVVTTNPGCLLQMRAGLDQAGASHIETLHIADFLERSLTQMERGT